VLYQLSYLGTAGSIVIDSGKMSNQSKLLLPLILIGLLPACSRSHPQPQGGETQKTPGTFARILGSNAPAEYGWDGQASSTTVDGALTTFRPKAVAALRTMDFVINEEASRVGKTTATVEGAKTDHTTATVWLEEKEPGGKTTIRVKIGSLGDRTGSERVLDEIQRPPGSRKK